MKHFTARRFGTSDPGDVWGIEERGSVMLKIHVGLVAALLVWLALFVAEVAFA